MIEISKRGQPTKTFNDAYLPEICQQVCGGGWTASQTATAMILRNAVERYGVGKYKGVTVKKVAP